MDDSLLERFACFQDVVPVALADNEKSTHSSVPFSIYSLLGQPKAHGIASIAWPQNKSKQHINFKMLMQVAGSKTQVKGRIRRFISLRDKAFLRAGESKFHDHHDMKTIELNKACDFQLSCDPLVDPRFSS